MHPEDLPQLAGDLVSSICPSYSSDTRRSIQLRDLALREIRTDTRGGTRKEWSDVKKALDGLSRSAEVRMQVDLAEALGKVTRAMQEEGGRGNEGNMRRSKAAQTVQFLLNLSNRPTLQTHEHASSYLHRAPPTISPETALYREIMSEPFEGEHWGKGYDDEVHEGWTDSEDSEDAESSESEEILTPSSRNVKRVTRVVEQREDEWDERVREAQEVLRLREAYWTDGGMVQRSVPEGLYGWRDVTTKTHALTLSDRIPNSRLISIENLQREILHALSGRPNLLSSTLVVRHYTPTALSDLTSHIGKRASQLDQLRALADCHSMTAQAFSEACRRVVQEVDTWLAEIESAFALPSSLSSAAAAASPLQLCISFDKLHGDILDHLVSFLPYTNNPHQLLNAIHAALSHTNQCPRLLSIFTSTAEPMWRLIRAWLRGMPVPAALLDTDAAEFEDEPEFDPEFFIQRDKDVSWADEDFWECAWIFRDESTPQWLDVGVLQEVIEAGKARGLLRAFEWAGGEDEWVELNALLEGNIRDALSEYLQPLCEAPLVQLRLELEGCGMFNHLSAIEATMYHRGFDVIDVWSRWLFDKVGAKLCSSDLQLLTSTYRELVDERHQEWMNGPAVRLSLASSLRRLTINRGGELIRAIRADYIVPFPLSQVFTLTSLDMRADAFTFLLELRYASSRMNEAGLVALGRAELQVIRQRLMWVIQTISVWINDRVITIETTRYRRELEECESLRQMIKLELSHTRRVRKLCFQHAATSSMTEAMAMIFELASRVYDLCRTARDEALVSSDNARSEEAPEESKVLTQGHVQGRSRRRIIRGRRRDDSSDEDAEDRGEELHEDENEVEAQDKVPRESERPERPDSFAPRVRATKGDLDEAVQTLKIGVEDVITALGERARMGDEQGDDAGLTRDGDRASNDREREYWEMLRFALDDWVE